MPTNDATFQTSIAINGKMDPNILKFLTQLTTEVGKTVKQEKELGKESKKTNDGMSKGMAQATKQAKELSGAMKEMLLPLLGISVAFKGFQTVGDTIQAAIDKFRGAKEAAANFKATLDSILGKGRSGKVENFDVAQQGRMKDLFTGIYGAGLFRDAQLELNRAGIALGDKAFAGFIQTTAYLKQDLKITGDDAVALAAKVSKAFTMPRMARGDPEISAMLKQMGINIDQFSKMSRMDRLKTLVAGFKQMDYISKRIADNREKDNLELMRAGVEEGGLLKNIGEFWEKLQTKGLLVSQHLKNAFLEAFIPASDAIYKLLSGPLDDLDKQTVRLKDEFRKIFSPGEKDTGYSKTDIFGNVLKAWKEDILPEIQKDWENLGKTEFISPGIYVEHPFLRGLKEGAEALLKAAEAIGKISWSAMEAAAIKIGEAAAQISAALSAFGVRTPEQMAADAKQLKEDQESGKINPYAFATGGMVNSPQYGLVGEAGPESIIPLRRDSNTLDLLGATFSALGINPMDPNAYGHELFGSGGFGLGFGGAGGVPGVAGFGGPIRAEAYGPSQGEYTRDTLFGPTGAHLMQGDYAVSPDLSAGHYLGQMFRFTDAGGNTHTGRYADASYRTSGHPNSRTIEEWNGRDLGTVSDLSWFARGGIVSKKMLGWLGEAGKEAVIPLEGTKGKSALQGLAGGHTFNFSPNITVSGVATSDVVDDLVSELRRNFGRWIEDAAFEHERRAFS